MGEKIVVSLREISRHFGIGIEGARAKAMRRAARSTWRILPQIHPADPLRIELPADEWTKETKQKPSMADPSGRLTEQSTSNMERLIIAEREKGAAELRAAVAVADYETAEKNLADMCAELEALRERLVSTDLQHREAKERRAIELRQAKAELEALKSRPWWKRLAS